jgi:hypothetical protein
MKTRRVAKRAAPRQLSEDFIAIVLQQASNPNWGCEIAPGYNPITSRKGCLMILEITDRRKWSVHEPLVSRSVDSGGSGIRFGLIISPTAINSLEILIRTSADLLCIGPSREKTPARASSLR